MRSHATISELAAWLRARDDIAVIGHVNPDGDAIGSCMALKLALESMGKRAAAVIPGALPHMYERFPRAGEIVDANGTLSFVPKAAIALDVSEKNRMGAAEAIFDCAADTAMLDHHGTNSGFGDLYHVEGDCPATGQLALSLIEALGIELNEEIATWLFVAISSDTGHFAYAGTSRQTFEAAGRLAEAGVDIPEVTRRLWYTRTLGRTRLLARVLSGLEVSADGRMAWARLTNDMFLECGAQRADSEGIVNFLLEIEGVEFAALAEERENGTKFSLRAKYGLNVAEDVAKPFGGGGHAKAAGCTLNLPVDEALKAVLAQAERAMEKNL